MSEQKPLLGANGKQAPPMLFAFAVLGVLSLLCFGSYFAYDSIQNLGPIMKQVKWRRS
jgi:hypothetical protein